jgi:hypothetical protein
MSGDKRLVFTVRDAEHFLLRLDKEGLCVDADPDLFISDSKSPHRYDYAKSLCKKCPLINECFVYAVETRVMGCWGGTDDWQREKFRKEQRRQQRLADEKKEQEIEH